MEDQRHRARGRVPTFKRREALSSERAICCRHYYNSIYAIVSFFLFLARLYTSLLLYARTYKEKEEKRMACVKKWTRIDDRVSRVIESFFLMQSRTLARVDSRFYGLAGLNERNRSQRAHSSLCVQSPVSGSGGTFPPGREKNSIAPP